MVGCGLDLAYFIRYETRFVVIVPTSDGQRVTGGTGFCR